MVSDIWYLGGYPEIVSFQSALRFAVASDLSLVSSRGAARFQSALRFAVVSDHALGRPEGRTTVFQSALRFAAVSDPTLLACCPGKPCCGVLTHRSFSPPPTSGQNLSSMGQNP